VTKGHLARAVLEATAWQTREVVDAMNADSGIEMTSLKADGGMTAKQPAHAVPRRRARRTGGAAQCRRNGFGSVPPTLQASRVGFWPDIESLRANWHKAAEWIPNMDESERERGYRKWKKAVQRTLDWVDDDD